MQRLVAATKQCVMFTSHNKSLLADKFIVKKLLPLIFLLGFSSCSSFIRGLASIDSLKPDNCVQAVRQFEEDPLLDFTEEADEEGYMYFSYSEIGDRIQVAYVDFEIVSNRLYIEFSSVRKDFQGQGIQNAMFKRILQRNPEVRSMSSSFVGTNKFAFIKALVKEMNEELPLHVDDETVDNYFIKNFLNKYEAYSDQQKAELLSAAYFATPAGKTRMKLGFKELCNGVKFVINNGDSIINRFTNISADVCR
jgi:GNAT superfamily N-acetyltransferase